MGEKAMFLLQNYSYFLCSIQLNGHFCFFHLHGSERKLVADGKIEVVSRTDGVEPRAPIALVLMFHGCRVWSYISVLRDFHDESEALGCMIARVGPTCSLLLVLLLKCHFLSTWVLCTLQ